MGQILGLGYSGGDKTKQSSTPQVPPELRQLYGAQTDVAQSLLPAYKAILNRGMGGDESVGWQFAAPTRPGYTSTMASTYQPTAGAYAPLASTYAPTAGAFIPGVSPAMAPYALQLKNAMATLQRTTPAGGGREAARGTLLAQAGSTMAGQQAAAAQKDIDARNAITQADLLRFQQLQGQDVTNANALTQADLLRAQQLSGQDVTNQNALQVADIQARNAFLQKILANYASLFSGFNPAAQTGTQQVSTTGSNIGVPFANISTG